MPCAPEVEAATEVPMGHKIALRDIRNGEDIVKYGIVIGRATADIPAGSWVHLHVMRSVYDQRSSHLDVRTRCSQRHEVRVKERLLMDWNELQSLTWPGYALQNGGKGT